MMKEKIKSMLILVSLYFYISVSILPVFLAYSEQYKDEAKGSATYLNIDTAILFAFNHRQWNHSLITFIFG